MEEKDVYQRLAAHLSHLTMSYPVREDLIEILRENYSPQEAEVAMAFPTKVIPLDPVSVKEISLSLDLPEDELVAILEGMVMKGLLYSAPTKDGPMGYALHQPSFGFPQTFFWKGQDTPHARKMAKMVAKYFNRQVTQEAFSPTQTKPYRYIPVGKSIKISRQAVYPLQLMEDVIQGARSIAVAHCPCRMGSRLAGKGCEHPTEVCMKFNDLARFLIDRGFARELTKEEALDLIRKTEEAGLVHFVDNAEGEIQHGCNCCGCACWNVGNIRRRKIPRDVLMATYFLRETDEERCTGCGACLEICPVAAVKIDGEVATIDKEWCIGCGVCSTVCPTDAVRIVSRPDRAGQLPAPTFRALHEKIMQEKEGN